MPAPMGPRRFWFVAFLICCFVVFLYYLLRQGVLYICRKIIDNCGSEEQHSTPPSPPGRWSRRRQSELQQLSPVSLLRTSPLCEEQSPSTPSRQPGWQGNRGHLPAEPDERPRQSIDISDIQRSPQVGVNLEPILRQHGRQDQTPAELSSDGSDKDPPPPYPEEPPPSFEEATRQTRKKCEVFVVEASDLGRMGAAAEQRGSTSPHHQRSSNTPPPSAASSSPLHHQGSKFTATVSTEDFWRTAYIRP